MTRTQAGVLAVAAVVALGLGLLTSGDRQQDSVPTATSTAEQASSSTAADPVIRNARIHTQNPAQPEASSVAILDGAIIAVGDDAASALFVADSTRVIDAEQGMLLPGFHDAHVHPLSSGEALLGCSLSDAASEEAILEVLQGCAASDEDGWLVGLDFNLGLFPNGNPHKASLDALFPERPVYLAAADGHSAWVNSSALTLAGITADTPNPPQGVIERDPDTGEATGTLRETAQALVSQLLPESAWTRMQ